MNLLRPLVRFRRWVAELHPARLRYGSLALTLAIGLTGCGLFLLARLPLPWMLGPMVLAMVIGLAGVPLSMPQAVRSPMLVVLGVMVGATATPELVSRISEWLMPLAGLIVVLIAGTAASFVYFRRIVGYD